MHVFLQYSVINNYSSKTYVLLHLEHKNDVDHNHCQTFVWSYDPQAKFVTFDNDFYGISVL